MHFHLPLASIVGLLALASAAVLPVEEDSDLLFERQTPTGPCPTGVHVLAVPGEDIPDDQLSLLGTLTADVVNAIPGSDFVRVPYPAPQNSTDGERITIVGRIRLHRYMRRYNRFCPDTKLVLLGYSAGGVIVMNTVCGQTAPYPFKKPAAHRWSEIVMASVVYGDQTFITGQPYNLGTCTSGSGRFPRFNTTGCDRFQGNMQSYCDVADPQCCSGDDPNAHFGYASEYDGDATNFVVGKWNALQASLGR